MPNWCSNVLDVTGENDELYKFMEDVALEDSPLSFEKILPTPPELLESNGINIFSDDNWYGWRLKNWGCKWDLNESTEVTKMDKIVTYVFDTAWNPPVPFIKKLGMLYPNFTFNLSYAEPGNCFAGVLNVKGEEIIEEVFTDGNSVEYKELMERFYGEGWNDNDN